MKGIIKKLKDSNNDYVFPMSVSEAVYVNPSTSLKDKLASYDTAIGEGFKSYTIDLERWGIVNYLNNDDTTDSALAAANSQGINAALQWADQQGYTEIIFPKGIYLIHENNPITPYGDYKTINLGGATFRIRDNGSLGYNVISISKANNFLRVTNGIIQGDRYNHDYSAPGDHSGGNGICLGARLATDASNINFIMVDNCEISNFSGDCIAISMFPQFVGSTDLTTWEQGGIKLTDGTLITDATRIRLVNYIDLTKLAGSGHFQIGGNGIADMGSDIIVKQFDVVFYDSSNNFVSSTNNVEAFEDILVPTNAVQAKLVWHQGTLPNPANNLLSFCNATGTRHAYVEHCDLHHSRRCGISGEGKYVYIRNNRIHHITGADPQCVIDVEDGFRMNEHWYFQGNHCHDCVRSLSFVSTRNVIVTDNHIDRMSIAGEFWQGCQNVSIERNILTRAAFTIDCEVVFTSNRLYRGSANFRFDTIAIVSNNYFHNSALSISKTAPFKCRVDNCHFYTDAEYTYSQNSNLFYFASPQTVSNCTFEGIGTSISGDATAKDYKFIGNTFINISTGTNSMIKLNGLIENCKFINCVGLGFTDSTSGNDYIFSNCKFEDMIGNITFSSYGSNLNLYLKNCHIKNTANDIAALFHRDLGGVLEITNCIFEYPNANSVFNIIDGVNTTFTCKRLAIKGCTFSSNKALEACYLIGTPFNNLAFFEDNRLFTVTHNFSYDSNHHYKNNYLDGNDPSVVASIPTSGYFPVGQMFTNKNPTSGVASGYIGWICTVAGRTDPQTNNWQANALRYAYANVIFENGHYYIETTSGTSTATKPTFPPDITSGGTVTDNAGISNWSSGSTYNVGDLVFPTTPNGYYYKCKTASGSSTTTEPTWSTSTTTTDSVGNVWDVKSIIVWKEIGVPAVFKTYGQISP